MKKTYAAVMLCVAMLAALASGCAQQNEAAALRPGTAEHDILTLEPVSEEKLLITMRGADNINSGLIEQALEAQFPNVEIVFSNNTNAQDLKEKNFEDIYLTASPEYLTMWDPKNTFIDLTNRKFVNNYYPSALNSCKYDGSLYYLPGPSTVLGVVYDKELFAENGWEVPHSLTEFEALCTEINATGIRAYQPSLLYHSAVKVFFSAFNYSTVFAGADNIGWLQDFQSGEETMAGHMEPALERMEHFLELGIYQPGDFAVQPGERSRMLYLEHSCAMIQEGLAAAQYAKDIGGEQAHEVGIMPFWSGDGPDDDYVFTQANYYIAANKKLEEPGNEEKLKAVLQILEYLGTPEGQAAIMPEEAPMIGSVRGSSPPDSVFAEHILDTLEKGNQVPFPQYGDTLVGKTDTTFTALFREFSEGTKTAAEVLAACDLAQEEMLGAVEDAGLYSIGTAAEDFTVLETAEYIADIFRRKTDAEIGLCCANTRKSGCNTELYKGDILNFEPGAENSRSVCYELDRGFGYADPKDEIGSCLTKITMTGENIRAALNEAYASGGEYSAAYTVSSGLKIEFAPWAGEGNRVVSVTLADGSELEPERLYTVACWNGTVDPERITEVETVYEDTFLELFEEALKTDGPISPFKDGRFTLNWDIIIDE